MAEREDKPTDEKLLAKPIELTGLLGYQDGAVVSRTLVDKRVGTITIFSFDQGQGLSEHTAPYDAYVQIADGAMDITVEGAVNRVEAGRFIIMPARKPHALRAVVQSKMLLVMIRA